MWIKVLRSAHFCWQDDASMGTAVPATHEALPRRYCRCRQLYGRMLSGQSTKTNKAASDMTIEARVVMSFVCVEWRGVALSLTGHWLAVCSEPFKQHQSNDRLWDNYHRSASFVKRTAYYAQPCKCCCEFGLCLAFSLHATRACYRTISGCCDNHKVADSAIDITISPNRWYEL